jgi:hypothetical protein
MTVWAIAAGVATIEKIRREKLAEKVATQGRRYLKESLTALGCRKS